MYNTKSYATDFTTDGAADSHFQIVPISFSFTVEEDQMWCQVAFSSLVNCNHATDTAFVTMKVDGVFLAGTATTLGLACAPAALTTTQTWLTAATTVKLAAGIHTLTAWVRGTVDTQTVTLKNSTLPCVLSVMRLSNNAVLAHGVDSKVGVNE